MGKSNPKFILMCTPFSRKWFDALQQLCNHTR